jgi:NAD(P)-dependent dehydrogenase (short-subunit alcohol dehydrogenase family)
MTPGRTAVVTGAASGIGRAAADRLASLGMNLVLADRDEAALEAAAAALKRSAPQGVEVLAVPTDVSDPAAVAALKAATDRALPDVAVVMNNAGWAPGGGPFGPLEGWRQVIEVNLFGVLHGIQAFAPDMVASGRAGCIVNTGSKQGITAPPGDTAYNVSKAGVKVLTEGLAHALRSGGGAVTAHLLIPGFVWTGMTARSRGAATAALRPAGAWTPEETVDFMLARLAEGAFYILCPDGETTLETDRRRILWAAGDLVEDRPALSRWHPDFKEAFAAFLAPPHRAGD